MEQKEAEDIFSYGLYNSIIFENDLDIDNDKYFYEYSFDNKLIYGDFKTKVFLRDDGWQIHVFHEGAEDVSQEDHRMNCIVNSISQLLEEGYAVDVEYLGESYQVAKKGRQIVIDEGII